MPRIVRLHAFGGPENLRIDDLPQAEPGAGEARLRVEAVGLSRDQLPFLAGADYGGGILPELPTRFGYEVAGVVEAVGTGVDPGWIGRRVAPIGPFDQERYGSVGDEAIVPADLLAEYPDAITPEQAAALWVPYLTAYALVEVGGIRAGDDVVIAAASSAVGIAAMQIALDAGARPIAVTRTSAKAQVLGESGAHAVIVTATEDYAERVAEITEGRGARITFDPVGGDFLTDAAAGAAPGGIVIEYGILGGAAGRFPVEHVIGKGLTIRGYAVSEVVTDPQARARAAEYVRERVADGRFVPPVAAVFPLSEVQEAFAHVTAGATPGRTVLVTAERG